MKFRLQLVTMNDSGHEQMLDMAQLEREGVTMESRPHVPRRAYLTSIFEERVSRSTSVQIHERPARADLSFQSMSCWPSSGIAFIRAGYPAGIRLSVDCVSASVCEFDRDCA